RHATAHGLTQPAIFPEHGWLRYLHFCRLTFNSSLQGSWWALPLFQRPGNCRSSIDVCLYPLFQVLWIGAMALECRISLPAFIHSILLTMCRQNLQIAISVLENITQAQTAMPAPML